MGDKEHQEFNSLISILNDLAKGQKVMMELMGKLTDSGGSTQIPLGEQQKKGPINDEGSNNAECSHARKTMQNHPHIYNKTSRPTMTQFLNETTIGQEEQVDQDEPFGAYLWEYRRQGQDIQEAMTFTDLRNVKMRNKPKGTKRAMMRNQELQKTLRKVTIPCFDGSSKCSAISWVQKMDTYFQLHQMTEENTIKLATLHLNGEAHDGGTMG